jgi:hypothetical protein
MTPVSGIGNAIAVDADRPPRLTASAASSRRAAGTRAVIALAPIASRDAGLNARPQAGFLAQLIATADKLPQTRERRRADPAEAIAAYGAATAARRPTGRRLARLI